jgi:hypothetical protein
VPYGVSDLTLFIYLEPFDMQTPAGLRTAYPLKKMDTVEVVRRGIQYDLPRLRGTSKPRAAQG